MMVSIAEQVAGERVARMVLSMIAEPDDQVTGHVLAQAGGVETLRLLESDDPIPKMSRGGALLWRERLGGRLTPDLLDRGAAVEGQGIGTLISADDHWPTGLNDLGIRAPYVLWTRGATSFLAGPLRERVTITGSRAATNYGTEIARDLAANLADDERIIVAGGAFGIEGAAHRGALAQGGQTIAVLACGVDRAYPSAHRDLLEQIGDVGLLASELPPGTVPSRERFLARGRLLAALSGATVIPEAGVRSGAIQTADRAYALRRGLGAVPGPVTSAASQGSNDLIKRGVASMVTETRDIVLLIENGLREGRGAVRSTARSELEHRPERKPPSGGMRF